MESLNKIAIAESLITKEFTFLEEDGYERKSEVVNSETFIAYMRVEYTNAQRKREVSISYTEGNVYDDIKYTFGVSITRVPYLDVEDSFALFIYLDSIGEDFSTSMVNHFDEMQAEQIVKNLAGALKYYAGDIISGKEWLGDYWARW
jgi:hypothetical protein